VSFQTVALASASAAHSPTSGLAGAPDKFKKILRGSDLVYTDWYHPAITNFPAPLFSIQRNPFPKLHLMENLKQWYFAAVDVACRRQHIWVYSLFATDSY